MADDIFESLNTLWQTGARTIDSFLASYTPRTQAFLLAGCKLTIRVPKSLARHLYAVDYFSFKTVQLL